MTSLLVDTPNQWEEGERHDVKLIVAAGQTILAGQLLIYGANAQEVTQPVDLGAIDFAGVALTGGVGGDRIDVRQRGLLVTDFAGTFAALSEGTAAFGEMSATADNNVLSITETSLNNLPIGKVNRVITAGAAGKAVFLIEADGFR
jgi:hypothetical protein